MLILAFKEHVQCTREEKLSCLPLINEMVSLRELGRREGFLAFDGYARNCENTLLRVGLELIVDGLDKQTVCEYLTDMLMMSDKKGVELLKQYIAASAILDILNGDSPLMIKKHLTMLLGEDIYNEVMKPGNDNFDLIDAINSTAYHLAGINKLLTLAKGAVEEYDTITADDEVLAFLLLHLKPDVSAKVFETLDLERQIIIAGVMADTDFSKADLAAKMQDSLHQWKRIKAEAEIFTAADNTKRIARMLRALPKPVCNNLLNNIEEVNEELFTKIQDNLFDFEDIANLDNQTVQRILRDVYYADLALALKMSSDNLKRVIFSNVSERVRAMIVADAETLESVHISDVDAAQRRIVKIIRNLADKGEITVSK